MLVLSFLFLVCVIQAEDFPGLSSVRSGKCQYTTSKSASFRVSSNFLFCNYLKMSGLLDQNSRIKIVCDLV